MRPQTVHVSATPGNWEMEQHRRRLRRAGHPPDRPHRSAGRDPPGAQRRSTTSSARCSEVARARLPHARHRADQAHGRGPHRIPARARRARALHALRHRHDRAHRDHPRPAPRRLRRAGRHQPAARGPRHSRMRARRHPRRRQGRLPALRNLADPDHRPRRAQRRRQGHPLCRPDHRLDGARHGRDQPPPREAAGLQRRARHHAGKRSSAASRDILGSVYERDHVTRRYRPRRRRQPRSATTSRPTIADLEKRMREAAANLEFEEAARLRDEIKRLQAIELAIADDPLARQQATSRRRPAAYAGERKYGRAANLPVEPGRASPPTPKWARTIWAAAKRARSTPARARGLRRGRVGQGCLGGSRANFVWRRAALTQLPLLTACGEKVAEGRMRGSTILRHWRRPSPSPLPARHAGRGDANASPRKGPKMGLRIGDIYFYWSR